VKREHIKEFKKSLTERHGSDFVLCRECGACDRGTKLGERFASPTLCKSCATKKAESIVEVAEGILASEHVLKRLRRKADSQIPRTWIDTLGEVSYAIIFLLLFIGFFYLLEFKWAFGLLLTGLPLIAMHFVARQLGDFIQSELSQPREAKVQVLITELARQRKEKFEEAERFYTSPEWNTLRELVISEEGSTCKKCGREIRRQSDVTVDHIKPRSKHRELALARSNLQVLCRRCNSKKRDRLLEEEEDKSGDMIRSSLPGDVKKQKRKLRKVDEVIEKITGNGE